VSAVRYELGFYIPEDGILHSHRRENLSLTTTTIMIMIMVIITTKEYNNGSSNKIS
jgi:hypothetical protein